MRVLKFFSSPSTPQWFRITVNDQFQTELAWDRGVGISKWMVFGVTAASDTLFFSVSEPRLQITKPQKRIINYSVASFSEDNKLGPPTFEITDYFSYGKALAEEKNYSEAIRMFELAQEQEPDDQIVVEIYRTLLAQAEYHIQVQEYEAALIALAKARQVDAAAMLPVLLSIQTYSQMGAYREGINFIDSIPGSNSEELLRHKLALLYLDQDFTAVMQLGRSYLASFGEDLDVLGYLSHAAERSDDLESALIYTRQAVAQKPDYDDHLRIGQLLYQKQDPDGAITHLQRMLTLYVGEQQAAVYNLLGMSYFLKREYGYAAEYLENAVRLNPGMAEFSFNLAQVYAAGRKPLEAQTYFQKAWDLNPEDYQTGFAYAQALEKNNKLDEALAVLDRVNLLTAGQLDNAEFHIFYSDLLVQKQRYDDALREIELALKQNPGNASLKEKQREVGLARDRANQNRNPLEVSRIEIEPLYPSLKEYYRDHPIGSITLFNTRNVCIQNVNLTVIIPNITDAWIELRGLSVLANSELEVDIFALLNNSVFTLCKTGECEQVAELRLEYDYDFQSYTDRQNFRVRLLRNEAMNWNDRKQLGCFINPQDNNLRSFVVNSILPVFTAMEHPQTSANILNAAQIYAFYHANEVRYLADPSSSNISGVSNDYIQYPFQTLELKRGDCDDLLVLLAASLSTIGVETGFIDIPGHVMLVFDSGLDATQITRSGFNTQHFIHRYTKFWIPVETTLLGKESFNRSWLHAINRYQEIFSQGILPDLIEFSDSQRSYPPVSYTGVPNPGNFTRCEQARAIYEQDARSIMLLTQITIEEQFQETLRRYPANLVVKNQYALWSVEQGKTDNALRLWRDILEQDAQNFSALVNLGNLHLGRGEYESARNNYLSALATNRDNDNVYRNLCVLEYKRNNLPKAREYYALIRNKNVLSKISPQMYADILGVEEKK